MCVLVALLFSPHTDPPAFLAVPLSMFLFLTHSSLSNTTWPVQPLDQKPLMFFRRTCVQRVRYPSRFISKRSPRGFGTIFFFIGCVLATSSLFNCLTVRRAFIKSFLSGPFTREPASAGSQPLTDTPSEWLARPFFFFPQEDRVCEVCDGTFTRIFVPRLLITPSPTRNSLPSCLRGNPILATPLGDLESF